MVEKIEKEETMEVDKEASGETPMEQDESEKMPDEASKKNDKEAKKADEAAKKVETKKQKVKTYDLPIIAPTFSNNYNVNALIELEVSIFFHFTLNTFKFDYFF